jgi:hypothetical protein
MVKSWDHWHEVVGGEGLSFANDGYLYGLACFWIILLVISHLRRTKCDSQVDFISEYTPKLFGNPAESLKTMLLSPSLSQCYKYLGINLGHLKHLSCSHWHLFTIDGLKFLHLACTITQLANQMWRGELQHLTANPRPFGCGTDLRSWWSVSHVGLVS